MVLRIPVTTQTLISGALVLVFATIKPFGGQTTEPKWYAKPSRDKCAKKYSCFSDPNDCDFRKSLNSSSTQTTTMTSSEICESFILYRENPHDSDKLDFYMERSNLALGDTDKYIALGLGITPEMGGSFVIMCHASSQAGSQNFQIVNRFNEGYRNVELSLVDSVLGLTDSNAAFINDGSGRKALACRFTRDKFVGNQKVFKLATSSPGSTSSNGTAAGSGKKRQTNHTSWIPLNYYLMLTEGNMKNNIPQYHAAREPHVSSVPISLAKSVIADSNSWLVAPTSIPRKRMNALTRAHGILMIIAWIFFVTVATLNARHLKMFCPQKTFCGGLKYWFVVHRTFNYIAVVLIIISTIIIFVKARQWSPFVHSITGIIAVIMAIIQPIAAYFRPHPGTTKRTYFNWFHRIIGTISLILAFTSIFLATKFPGLIKNPYIQNISKIMISLVVIYGITEIIIYSIYFIRKFLKNKMSSNKISYDLTRYDNNANVIQPNVVNQATPAKVNKKWDMTKFYIIHMYALIALGLALAMSVLLGLA